MIQDRRKTKRSQIREQQHKPDGIAAALVGKNRAKLNGERG